MSGRFLDDEARAAFTRAIETIEAASAVEVVVALRRRSHGYPHANIAIGAAVGFLGLAAMLFAEQRFSLLAILFDPFVVGIIAGYLVELLPGVKRALTPALRRQVRVRTAARSTFVERGVHATRDRSGVLVYISWLERQVVLVPDVGFAAVLSGDAIHAAERALTAAMRKGGAAVAGVLARLAPEFAKALPRRADDINELPDALDTDEGRR